MVDPVVVAEDSFFSCFSAMTSLTPAGAVHDDGAALHLHTGARVASFNLSLARVLPDDVAGLLAAAMAFHDVHRSPAWTLAVRGTDASRFRSPAEAAGFSFTTYQPFMVLDPIPLATLPAGLTVRRATDLDGLLIHFGIVALAFGMPLDALDGVITERLLDDRFLVLLGEVDGRPVTTSVVSVSAGAGVRCAGVYNVATLESHRRRGLGEAMTAHAAEVARAKWGCTVATLQSSVMGYPIYARMGYREVTRWQLWTPPASTAT